MAFVRKVFNLVKTYLSSLKTSQIIANISGLIAIAVFLLQPPPLIQKYIPSLASERRVTIERLPCEDLFRDSTNYKIIVLPFFKNCETGRDIGLEIRNRLVSLKYKDSLSIDVCYLDLFKQDANFTKDQAEKLRVKYRADQIIYGVNNSLNCLPQDTLLEVCVNYVTSTNDPSIKQVPINKIKTSLSEIQQGFLQANIDNIVYFFSAMSDKNKGKYEQGLRKLYKMRDIDFNGTFYQLKGSIYENIGDYDSAIANYDLAIKYNPISETFIDRGNINRLYLEQYDAAIRDYITAINNTRDISLKLRGFFNLSIAYYASYDYPKAIKSAENFVKFASRKNDTLSANSDDIATMYVVHGSSIFNMNKNEGDALEFYDKALKVSPKNKLALSFKATILEQQGDLGGALDIYNELIKNNPRDYGYYVDRSSIYYQRDDTILFKKDLISALKKDNYSARVYKKLGLKMREVKQNWYSLNLLLHAASIEADADTYREIADTYVELNLYFEAVKKYSFALALEPSNFDIIYDRGVAYQSAGKYKEAIQDFDRYIELNKHLTYRAYYYRAICKKIIGDKGGREDMKKAASMGMTLAQNFLRAYSDTTYLEEKRH